MKSKTRYKLQRGVQAITPDTPDYSKAYELQAQQGAVNKGISQAAGMFSGAYAPIGQLGGMAADVIRNRAKDKEKGATIGGAVEMGSTGAALGTAIAPGIGTVIGLAGGAIYGGMKGKKNYEKVKAAAQQEEKRTAFANANKYYHAGAETDAQSFLAKKGKYKVKTKDPSLIETEGREPIFSPKKPDGTRDLLYYNPNDPTHEEGGVKAVVMPKAQEGKRVAKSKPITIPGMKNSSTSNKYWNKDDEQYYTSGVLRNNDPHVRSKRRGNNTSLFKSMYPTKEDWQKSYRKEDSYIEDFAELIDPTGILSHDDLARAIESYRKAQDPFDKGFAGFDVGTSGFSSIPIAGRGAAPFRLSRQLVGKQLAKNLPKYAKYLYKKADDAGNVAKTAWETTKKYGKKGLELGQEVSDYFGLSDVFSDKSSDNTQSGTPLQKKAYGAKQLKVNNLNNAAVSQNLNGMPAANAANKFILPAAGKSQVARQIPEDRRKEKIRTKRSHKKNPGPVKTVDPPMLYEMKPPPPRSTYNTKNDFKKGGKYIRTYQEGVDGTEANATYKHGKTFKDRMAYQEALRAHDDSLNLYKQSRYFTNLVNKSNLYQPTVENPPVKNVVRTGKSTTSSPTKPFGAPDDRNESFITIAGYNPVRKDLHSRKESKYKSFKEYEDAKAAGKNDFEHEGYEINMYKHPEMAVNYAPDTVSPIKVRTPKLKIPKDSIVTKTPKQVVIPNTKTPTKDKEEVVTNKPRGKFIAKEKTTLEKLGEKASEFFNKIGSSNRPVNGRRITVFK